MPGQAIGSSFHIANSSNAPLLQPMFTATKAVSFARMLLLPLTRGTHSHCQGIGDVSWIMRGERQEHSLCMSPLLAGTKIFHPGVRVVW